MRSTSLSVVAIAMTFVIQATPTLAQSFCAPGSFCRSHTTVRPAPTRPQFPRPQYPAQAQYQHYGNAHGWGQGNGIGVGAAALTSGALIGGAIAAQQQEYSPPERDYYPPERSPIYPRQHYRNSETSESDSGDLDRLCSKLRWTCAHKDELGLDGAGTCRRYRETCQ